MRGSFPDFEKIDEIKKHTICYEVSGNCRFSYMASDYMSSLVAHRIISGLTPFKDLKEYCSNK